MPTTTKGPDHKQDMFTLQLCLAGTEESHNPPPVIRPGVEVMLIMHQHARQGIFETS